MPDNSISYPVVVIVTQVFAIEHNPAQSPPLVGFDPETTKVTSLRFVKVTLMKETVLAAVITNM